MARKKKNTITPEEAKIIQEEAEDAEFRDVDPNEPEELTPAQFFQKLKEESRTSEDMSEALKNAIELAEKRIKKFEMLRQTDAAKLTKSFFEMFKRESRAIEAGYTKYVLKKDVIAYAERLRANDKKNVYITDLEDFPREIPDDVVNKVYKCIEDKIFDHLYIMYTDYTGEIKKAVEKRHVEKDPIIFGAFDIHNKNRIVDLTVGPRFYFIADWVDEYCDITLTDFLNSFTDKKPHEFEVGEMKTSADLNHAVEEYTNEIANNKNLDDIDKFKKPKD